MCGRNHNTTQHNTTQTIKARPSAKPQSSPQDVGEIVQPEVTSREEKYESSSGGGGSSSNSGSFIFQLRRASPLVGDLFSLIFFSVCLPGAVCRLVDYSPAERVSVYSYVTVCGETNLPARQSVRFPTYPPAFPPSRLPYCLLARLAAHLPACLRWVTYHSCQRSKAKWDQRRTLIYL